jgi:pimeloyl-ACP methyl ester carboxylesterase
LRKNARNPIMKLAVKIAGIVSLFLLASAIISYVFQDKLIFQADTLQPDYRFSFNQPYEEYFITTPDSQVINALWFKPAQPAKGLVIYFHGNADNLQRWGNYAVDMTQLGYEVLMIDYRGYGKSSGKPNEKDFYDAARLVWNWAKGKTEHQRIILYGRSLGSAIATHLATEVQPDLLILETPFDELKEASALRLLFSVVPLHAKFPTREYLGKVKGKVVIFHGTNDWVVNLTSAERLRPLLKDNDEFIVIPDGGHNNLRDFVLYHTKLAVVLKE